MTQRTISGGTATELAKKDTILGWLVEIAFDGFTGRYSSYGQVTWNGLLFTSAHVDVTNLDTNAAVAAIRFFDADGSIQTLCKTGTGVRNRAVKLWKFYVNALGATDPMFMFKGVGDQVNIAKGVVDIACARASVQFLYAPRKRLGPATGCNFLAAPGTLIPWGGGVLRLDPNRG